MQRCSLEAIKTAVPKLKHVEYEPTINIELDTVDFVIESRDITMHLQFKQQLMFAAKHVFKVNIKNNDSHHIQLGCIKQVNIERRSNYNDQMNTTNIYEALDCVVGFHVRTYAKDLEDVHNVSKNAEHILSELFEIVNSNK